MVHLFWEREMIQEIIECICLTCENIGTDTVLNINIFIFNRVVHNAKHIIHFVCTFTEQFIYKCRCMNVKLRIEQFKKF